MSKPASNSNERGRFRNMDMEELRKWAPSPAWDDESTQGTYIYPLRIEAARAAAEGKRIAVGNPADETYTRGPYVCATSPQTHIGPFKHAVDFLVPDDTPIVAAADGYILEAIQHHFEWGDAPQFRDKLNYLTIVHENGEFTQYCHLAQNSVRDNNLRPGDKVMRGQRIATVGMTGWTDRPHLHFAVFVGVRNETPFTFKSLRVRFE